MYRKLLVIFAVLWLLGAGVAVYLASNDAADRPAPVPVTVNGAPDDGRPAATLQVPEPAVEAAAQGLDEHVGARDESPEGVAADELEARREAVAENRAELDPLPTAGASAGFVGCRTLFVSNQSSRRGVRPTVQVLHYTVSPNRPGWSDVLGIVAFFDRSSSQASSHFVIDAEGNCAYIVPIEQKAWTQAGGNPFAISYEIIATGRESSYLGTAGYARLRSVMAQVNQRAGIPLQAGRISGCAPSRAGTVDHRQGGSCWGGHHDIGPFSLAGVLARVHPAPCGRACDLRKRNVRTHRALRSIGCKPFSPRSGGRCLTLHRRDRAIHAAARRESIRL